MQLKKIIREAINTIKDEDEILKFRRVKILHTLKILRPSQNNRYLQFTTNVSFCNRGFSEVFVFKLKEDVRVYVRYFKKGIFNLIYLYLRGEMKNINLKKALKQKTK